MRVIFHSDKPDYFDQKEEIMNILLSFLTNLFLLGLKVALLLFLSMMALGAVGFVLEIFPGLSRHFLKNFVALSAFQKPLPVMTLRQRLFCWWRLSSPSDGQEPQMMVVNDTVMTRVWQQSQLLQTIKSVVSHPHQRPIFDIIKAIEIRPEV